MPGVELLKPPGDSSVQVKVRATASALWLASTPKRNWPLLPASVKSQSWEHDLIF